MKVAEALILRADYQKRLEQLRQRLLRNAKVQEGNAPGEEPQHLLAELEQVAADLAILIQRINATNAATQLEGGQTIAAAIAERDLLRLRAAVYREMAQAATVTQDRYTKSEVKFKSTVDIAAVQQRADDLARQHRELDTRIQAANWQFDLRE
ncbi:MAG: DIP1984 family protein [Actinomycetota bacterium]